MIGSIVDLSLTLGAIAFVAYLATLQGAPIFSSVFGSAALVLTLMPYRPAQFTNNVVVAPG